MTSIKDAVDSYLTDLSVGQSPQTVETYSQGLARFSEFLSSTSHSPTCPAGSLSVDSALEFARWLTQDRAEESGPLAKASLRTYLASLSRFYSYLLRERIIDLSASDMERMRYAFREYRRGFHRPLPKLPPEEAVQSLIQAARRQAPTPKNPRLELARLRNIAMLTALRSSGMRVGELVRLRRDDLDHRVHSAHVTGKGEKQRVVYFDDEAWSAIQTYLGQRADGAKGRALYQLPVFRPARSSCGQQDAAADDRVRTADLCSDRARRRHRHCHDTALAAACLCDARPRSDRRPGRGSRYAGPFVSGHDPDLCQSELQAHEGRSCGRVRAQAKTRRRCR